MNSGPATMPAVQQIAPLSRSLSHQRCFVGAPDLRRKPQLRIPRSAVRRHTRWRRHVLVRAGRKPACNFARSAEAVAFHDPVTGEPVLGSPCRAINDERHAGLCAKLPGVQRRSLRAGLDQLAGRDQLPIEESYGREALATTRQVVSLAAITS